MKLPSSALCRGLLATAFALITLSAVAAADSFEGRVHMVMTTGKKKEAMGIDYALKGGKMRYDMAADSARRGAGTGGVIIDFKRQEMIILMEEDGQKNFMRQTMAPALAEAKKYKERPAAAPVATGRVEQIAGYPAAEYTQAGEKGEITELWLAKGLGTFMFPADQGPMGGRGPAAPGWEQMARDGGFFPLRVVTRDAKGAERSRMEVTKIDRTPLPDALFSTDGYAEFKMPDFGGAFNPFKQR